ncbi:MAG: hypothetical protein WCJ45_08225 [bacterium]
MARKEEIRSEIDFAQYARIDDDDTIRIWPNMGQGNENCANSDKERDRFENIGHLHRKPKTPDQDKEKESYDTSDKKSIHILRLGIAEHYISHGIDTFLISITSCIEVGKKAAG